MATHLCMFGTDHRNTGRSPCGGDSMAYTSTFNGERFVTRVHLADCDVCLVTAEQLITAGFAKYAAATAYEADSKAVAYLELTRDVAAHAPPGDWWACPCSLDKPQPLVLPDYAALYPGLRVVEGTEQPRCAFCARERGVVGWRAKFMRTVPRDPANSSYLLTGVK